MKDVTRKAIFLILIMFLVLAGLRVNAEESNIKVISDSMFYGEGFGGVTFGAIYSPSINSLNDRLHSLGYSKKLNDVIFVIGGQGFGYSGNVLMGGVGFSVRSSSVENNLNGTNIVVGVSGGFGFFELGYALLKSPNISIVPILGFGGGSYVISFKTKSEVVDFDTIAKNPYSHNNYISYGGTCFELGILTHGQLIVSENIVQISDNTRFRSHGTIGLLLKLSYIFMLATDNTTVVGEPKFGDHNFKLDLTVTFGGRTERL
ncbi:MAG: hypothetical protein N2712_04875 [Brevinematales bacterium]|nr:hypothetical protein [Brevinematales bacterium]